MSAWRCAEGHATSTNLDSCWICGRRRPLPSSAAPVDDVMDAVDSEPDNHVCATDGFGCGDCGNCGEPLTEHTWPRRHCPQPRGAVYDPNCPDEVYDSIGCVFH